MRLVRAGVAAAVLWACLVPRLLVGQGTVGGRLKIQELEDEPTHDLASAVIYLEPANGATSQAQLRDTPGEIAMHDKAYIPHVLVVTAGSTVTFPNQDPFRHNVFSNSTPGPFDLGLTPRGRAGETVLHQPGVYAIYCNIHSRMSAFIVVVATPYFAQPGADGTFSLASVPAGRYVLHAWHERGGATTQTVDVPAAGLDGVAVVLDARRYRAEAHRNKFGREYDISDDDERY